MWPSWREGDLASSAASVSALCRRARGRCRRHGPLLILDGEYIRREASATAHGNTRREKEMQIFSNRRIVFGPWIETDTEVTSLSRLRPPPSRSSANAARLPSTARSRSSARPRASPALPALEDRVRRSLTDAHTDGADNCRRPLLPRRRFPSSERYVPSFSRRWCSGREGPCEGRLTAC